jgi:hypothetical protein
MFPSLWGRGPMGTMLIMGPAGRDYLLAALVGDPVGEIPASQSTHLLTAFASVFCFYTLSLRLAWLGV